MKIGLIGRSELLWETAKLLNRKGVEIKFIITAKTLPQYRTGEEDFKKLARRLGCDFFIAGNLNSKKWARYVRRSGCEIGISVNYPSVVPRDVLKAFRFGVLNAHAGDLPRYRGNASPNWALLNGEKSLGLVIHKMNPVQLDSGDILAESKLPLGEKTAIGDVYAWMRGKVPGLFLQALGRLRKNPGFVLRKQSNTREPGFRCYPRLPADSAIDWELGASEIDRLIRASSEPFEGAYGFYGGKKIRIWRAELFRDPEKYIAVPGQLSKIDKKSGHVTVITGEGKLKITSVSVDSEGRKRQKPSSVLTSFRIRFEKSLGPPHFVQT
jgi:UDP-4-amino-4-deoxy-L-arabinose formyltransferase/UDP-glucuronic acid dehydrogenase (UDP-4-keto-hexauronic acid decarboxylating)